MPILNYTTTIPAGRTVGEIQAILARHGARRISVEYDAGATPAGLAFSVETPFGLRAFRLPARVDGVLAALKRQSGKGGKVSRSMVNREHAARVAWRILKDWTESQLAIVEAGLVTMDEALLPYMLGRDDRTVYEIMSTQQLSLGAPEKP